jgi:DNA-binding transcriptional ArsR family regulator
MDLALRALADRTRRRILALVWREERTAGDIASEFAVTRTAISQHLAVLRESELVTVRQVGVRRLYPREPKSCGEGTCGTGGVLGRPPGSAPRRSRGYRTKGQTKVSNERGVLEREIFISAPPESVFSFLIDPALMAHSPIA